jgi:hypothetical protein
LYICDMVTLQDIEAQVEFINDERLGI